MWIRTREGFAVKKTVLYTVFRQKSRAHQARPGSMQGLVRSRRRIPPSPPKASNYNVTGFFIFSGEQCGFEPERVLPLRKQCCTLFLGKRAERTKRGQAVCKALSAADGESHHLRQKPVIIMLLVFYLYKELTMDFYSRALELKDETIHHRRYLHRNAEVGLDMPLAREYISQQLSALGITPKKCGYGITATIGSGKPVVLLRADMDALPMQEESGESFACANGAAHTCGHDFHAAMLLTAAKLLKEDESSLKGTVKLMFQPAEETFEGSRNMIENGILESPAPDAALAFHVMPGRMPVGIYMFNCSGAMMLSADGFRIDIKGKGGHGAYPNLAVDPIQIAVQTHIALQTLISREADPEKKCVLTVGKLQAGNAPNIIPDSAVMEGTLRTNDPESRAYLVRRITEISENVAKTFGGSAKMSSLSAVAPLICDKNVTESMAGYISELSVPNLTPVPDIKANASEDFATIAEKLPSAMIYLSAGFLDERGDFSAHNPKVRFNEDVCPFGAAAYAHCAARWLEEHCEEI